MEKSVSKKSAYLLEAGVEVLHQQSIEWLSDVAFWKDEVAFFYALIVSKTLKEIPISVKDTIAKIEGDLVRITGGELDELQQEVELHEYYLCQMLESKRENQEAYREKHKQLAEKFDHFETQFKNLKKEIFKLVESIKKTTLQL